MPDPNNMQLAPAAAAAIEKKMHDGVLLAEQFVNRNYLIHIAKQPLVPPNPAAQSFSYDSLFEITGLVYDPGEGINDKLVSVYSALYSLGSSLLFVIRGEKSGVRLYIGTRDTHSPAVAGNLLERSLIGNFPGIRLERQSGEEIRLLMDAALPEEYERKNLAAVSVVPSSRAAREEGYVQGLEKFIETMSGADYTAVFIVEPLGKDTLLERKHGFEDIATAIAQLESATVALSESDSLSLADGLSESVSHSVGESVSRTTSTSDSFSASRSGGHSRGTGFNIPLLPLSTNSGRFQSTSDSESKSSSASAGTGESTSDATSRGTSKVETRSDSRSKSVTYTVKNRRVRSLLDQIEAQLKRIAAGEALGLWDSAAYFVSEDKETVLMAANVFKGLVSGDETSVEDAFTNLWDGGPASKAETLGALSYIRYGMHPVYELAAPKTAAPGRAGSQLVTPASAVNGAELSVFMGLPLKSVSGVSSIPAAEFGRSVTPLHPVPGRRLIKLGSVMHLGRRFPLTPVLLKANVLASHTLVVGSSGTGKSNAIYHVLEALGAFKASDDGVSAVPFLVVEPAKGEYKEFFGRMPGIRVFAAGDPRFDPPRLNPFAFPDGITVLEHLDRLIEIFSACWPLYAAMPAILKTSFERAYELVGWDLQRSEFLGGKTVRYPSFQDVLRLLPEIIGASEYSAQSKGDYTGALVTRVASLTTGTLGGILCDPYSIPERVLFDENAIVDISRLGSAEAKSLLMGLLILKLDEYRFSQRTDSNRPLCHVTVLEEAHNILRRCGTEQSAEGENVQGKSVEMICNAIAEMRTYGEGFIIADQSPSAIAKTAMINTATKLLFQLSDHDECESAGRSIGLTDAQIAELGKLTRGVAVVYQSGWLEPVQCGIEKASSAYRGASPQRSTAEALRQLTDELTEELLAEYRTKEFQERWLMDIVRRAKVSETDRQRTTAILTEFLALSKPERLRAFPELIVHVTDTKGMLRACPPQLSAAAGKAAFLAAPDRKKAAEWFSRIYNALDRYVTLPDPKERTQAAAQMMTYLAEQAPSAAVRKAAYYNLCRYYRIPYGGGNTDGGTA